MKAFFASVFAIGLSALPMAALSEGKITVTGHGRVETIPDMATISVGVTTEAKTSAEALTENSVAVAKVLTQVGSAGIAEKDIQTSGLSLSPIWSKKSSSVGDSRSITGFVVNNQVTIRVRELAILGTILDAVVKNGANRFHGLNFGVKLPEPLEDKARQLAIADGLRKAKLYAVAAGVELGQVLEINENGGSGYQPVMARGAMMSEAVPIAQGEISISASVTMVFNIGE